MDEQSQPAQGTLYLMFGLSNYSHFNKGNTQRTAWVFTRHTHTHTHCYAHKRYCSQGSAGVLVLKKVCVQLAAPTVLMWLVGSADCTRHIHTSRMGGGEMGRVLIFY